MISEERGGGSYNLGIINKNHIDYNSSDTWNSDYQVVTSGNPGDKTLAGDWNGDGVAGVNVKFSDDWYLARNDNDTYSGCETDACIFWGLPNH